MDRRIAWDSLCKDYAEAQKEHTRACLAIWAKFMGSPRVGGKQLRLDQGESERWTGALARVSALNAAMQEVVRAETKSSP